MPKKSTEQEQNQQLLEEHAAAQEAAEAEMWAERDRRRVEYDRIEYEYRLANGLIPDESKDPE